MNMSLWEILNISETTDKNEIRAAYMKSLSSCNPEDDPEGFQALRAAYENAMELADVPSKKSVFSTPTEDFIHDAIVLYGDFFRRIQLDEWRNLLKQDVALRLDTEDEVSQGMLAFLMTSHYLPHDVWRLLDSHFGWVEKANTLKQVFPPDFIDFVINHVQVENLRYELFEPDENIEDISVYTDAIALWNKARLCLDAGDLSEIDITLSELTAKKIYHPDFEMLEAELARLRGEFDLARAITEAQFAKYPNHIFTKLEYALLLQYEEKFETALNHFEQLLKHVPDFFAAKRGMIECLIELERYTEAREFIYKLLIDYPTSIFALSSFGLVNQELAEIYTKKYESGERDTETIIDLIKYHISLDDEHGKIAYLLLKGNPQIANHHRYPAFMAECLMQKGDFENAIEYFKKALFKESFYRTYGRLAVALLDADNPDEALRYIEIGLNLPEDDPGNDKANHARLYQLRGQAYARKKDYDAALKAYAIADSIQPFLAQLNLDVAMVHKTLRRYGESMDYLEKAMRIMPYDPAPYFHAMEMYYEADRFEDVLALANRAEANEAAHSRISYYKACALRLLERADEALDILLELVDAPEDDELPASYKEFDLHPGILLSEIAFLYWSKEDTAKADEYIRAAIEKDPEGNYQHWRNLLADICEVIAIDLIKKDDRAKALATLNEAIENNPNRTATYAQRGFLYLLNGNPNAALNDLLVCIQDIESLKERMDLSEVYMWIADIYAMYINNPTQATEFYRKVLKEQPKHPGALLGMAELAFSQKKYSDALKTYNKLMENDAKGMGHANYIIGRAHCLKAMGKWFAAWWQYRQAAKLIKKLLEADASDIILLAALSEAYHGLRKHAKARECENTALNYIEQYKNTLFIPLSFTSFRTAINYSVHM